MLGLKNILDLKEILGTNKVFGQKKNWGPQQIWGPKIFLGSTKSRDIDLSFKGTQFQFQIFAPGPRNQGNTAQVLSLFETPFK